VREQRARIRADHEFYEEQSRLKGIMSRSTYGKVMECLHPDKTPTLAQRQEACGLLSQWKQRR
jgi:hypothetical protein